MKYIIYIIIFFTIHSIQAQTYIKGKYDSKNHLFITKDTTYWIDFFQEGVARISNNGLFGLMNKKGKILCPPKYDLIYDFQNGLAITNIGKLFGIIDSKGKELIVPQFNGIEFLRDNIFLVRDNSKSSIIRSNGEILMQFNKYPMLRLNRDSSLIYYYNYEIENFEIGFINQNTWTEIPLFKKIPLSYTDNEKLKIITKYFIDFELMAFKYERINYSINKMHNIQNTVMINPILEYSNGLTINFEIIDKSYLFGFMDRNLKPIIKAEYTWVNAFKNGYATVFKNEKCGVIDTTGKTILPIEFNSIHILDNHHFIVKKEDKYGVIDKNNKVIIPIKYEGLVYTDNDLYAAFNGNKWGVIDEKEQLILDYEYHGINNGLAVKQTNIFMLLSAMHNAKVYYQAYFFDKNGLLDKNFIPMVKFFRVLGDISKNPKNFMPYTITKYPDTSKYDISELINDKFKIIGKHMEKCSRGGANDITQCFLKGMINANDKLVVPLLYGDIKQAKTNKQKQKLQTSVVWDNWDAHNDWDDWKNTSTKEYQISPDYNYNLNVFIVRTPNCKYGVIDINHQMILNLEYDYIEIIKGKIIVYKYLEQLQDTEHTFHPNCYHKTYLEQASAIFDFRGKVIEPFKKIEKR